MASRVGKYLLFETLGEGAFGKVKLGVHEETGEQVAVKIMDKSDIKAQEMTMNVRREIAIMKALKHRNIVNLRQVLTSHTKLYIVMDLVTGGELFTKILKEGKLEERVARRYFQQLVDGIDYCHKRGVCHRDLKPENLLIDETTGELKITDFGLSAMKGASTTEELLHTQCGSPNYCAPEIIARYRQGYNGTKVDAWSCGIILFALLAGFLPFFDENTKVLYRMIQDDDVKFPKRFPPEARDLVICLLHKEPDRRYTLAQVKRHPWFAVDYVGDDAPPKSTGSGSSPPGRARRKRGHGRKSSVDQAPRSKDFSSGRRKSDKSDADSGSSSVTGTSGVTFPDGPALPAPPPVVDVGARIPLVHRPPAPPTVSPPPRSPVSPRAAPPLVPPPPPPPPVLPPTFPPHHNVHGQPPPVPTPVPPIVTHTSKPGITRAVPPYPTDGTIKKSSRDAGYVEGLVEEGKSKQTYFDDVRTEKPGPDVNETPAASSSDWTAVDFAPKPPAFPAPDVRKGDALPAGVSTNSGLTNSESAISNGGVSVNSAAAPVETAEGTGTEQMEPVNEATGAALKSDTEKADIGSPGTRARSKWNVVLTPPPAAPSYGSAMAPVSTPAAVAAGDASWLKFPAKEMNDEPKPVVPRPFALQEPQDLPKKPEVRHDDNTGDNAGVTTKPLSIVEQRRLMYNRLANESDGPPPLPDTSFRTARSESTKAPESVGPPPAQRFGDRTEGPVITGYPTVNGSWGLVDRENGSRVKSGASSVPGYEKMQTPHASSEVSQISETSAAREESASRFQEASAGRREEGSTLNRSVQRGSDYSTSESSGLRKIPGLEDNDVHEAPLKERLAAAVARYRRIFKLGNKIGITASPSFTSNKGGGPGDSSGDEEASKNHSAGRSDFFARAKTVTGAWGIILTQELEEDSDSEDEGPQITESELQAFSRLLDFWDNRRASANVPKGGEVLLDDEESSPLSEEDIASIQSLLQKLEPMQVEEEMTEVADDVLTTVPVPTHGMEDNSVEQGTDNLEDLAVHDIHVVRTDNQTLKSPATSDSSIPMTGSTQPAVKTSAKLHIETWSPPPPPPPLPPLPPMPGRPTTQHPRPPPIPSNTTGSDRHGAVWDRGTDKPAKHGPSVPPPPAPPLPAMPGQVLGVQQGHDLTRLPPPPPPPPPAYAASSKPTVDPEHPRLVVTPSTVRDPFRPRAPPAYPPPQSPGSRSGSSAHDAIDPNVRTSNAKKSGPPPRRAGRHPNRASQDARRKSSTTTSEVDGDSRRTTSRDSGRGHSGASVASNGSGGFSKKGHVRSHSRDEHATRGLFAFGMFNRRKSSAMTSFDSDLAPDRCLLEVGRILTGMGCNVLVKQGESKMKCEAPLKQEKLFISITCTQEKKVSTVHFRRGRKDKSNVDAREFYEFFQVVHSRFQDRVQPDAHP